MRQFEAMRNWSADFGGAAPRVGSVNGIISADLPGAGLSFTGGSAGAAATLGLSIACITDPRGAYIELTEGLDDIR
jgi:hypothetical protein